MVTSCLVGFSGKDPRRGFLDTRSIKEASLGKPGKGVGGAGQGREGVTEACNLRKFPESQRQSDSGGEI